MATHRVTTSDSKPRRRRAATTPQARENQMINLAVDAAEDMMRSGNAPAQIVTHYLKLGSSREKLEQERLAMEVRIAEAKIEQMKSVERIEELYEKAIHAMQAYKGEQMPEEDGYEV